mmetsp:Transcript_25625/g.59520  ORF Transcript_25625/g.59520 Transcript_25625/m.59520 type:complete len:255 (+) Transcript_25625:3-767(+)
MISSMNVHSLMDVGCGRGISTTWFLMHGVDALCIEGSHDAWESSMLPSPQAQMIEHDYSRGPWWPSRTYDAIWCVEFLEHVGRNFHQNYLPTFRKAALIFATHSNWGGWHHVEVHRDDWWIAKMEMYGFRYHEKWTNHVRTLARTEKEKDGKAVKEEHLAPNDKPYNAQHVWLTMMVFVNPTVAALPEHAHLLYEPGCYQNREEGKLIQRDCGTGKHAEKETPLPDSYKPLQITPEQDKEWHEWVKARLQLPEK